MKVSDMKNKIDILTLKDNDGPFNSGDKYSVFLSSIWAKKEQLVGSQLVQAIGEGSKIPCNFIVRRNDSITNKMFVECNGIKFNIISACPLNKNNGYTILTCFKLES